VSDDPRKTDEAIEGSDEAEVAPAPADDPGGDAPTRLDPAGPTGPPEQPSYPRSRDETATHGDDDGGVRGGEGVADPATGRISVPEGVESVLPDDAPRIELPRFEGPLDLLLYLIRRDRIDIHDIPIAPITKRYMEYLDLMRELNLDVAGEFMLMAATLIHIKSKMLVPVEPAEAEGEEEAVDPREELVRRLLEFQRYKEAAGVLHQQAQIRAAQWTRPDTVLPRFDDAGEEMLEAGLYDLIAAFKEMLDRRKTLLAHEIEADVTSVEERMAELLMLIREGESLEFLELFATLETKVEMIVTFLALLELIRLKRVRVYQRGLFGAIRVFRPVGPPVEGAPPMPAQE
jgi:segregation and condensation protein A